MEAGRKGMRTESAYEGTSLYSCFDKGCPTKKHQSVCDNTERHDGLWLFTVASSISRVFTSNTK